MGVSEEDLTLLNSYPQRFNDRCYDKVVSLLTKYTFEEWNEVMDPDSMVYWTVSFGIID